MTWENRYHEALMDTFGPPQRILTRAQGCTVVDDTGAEYLDLLGGIAVNVLGRCHPAIERAVSTQLATLDHVSNFFATPPQIELAERVLGIVCADAVPDGSRVFFTNSGTESNECAIKMIRTWGNTKIDEGTKGFSVDTTPRIIALTGAFHGRSAGALSVTWKEAYRTPFAPLLEGIEFIEPNNMDALDRHLTQGVAGIIVEPIQGEAGVYPLSDEYLQAVRRRCNEIGALMVVDEVQSGMGRTGQWMAHHHAGITPDVVTLAKGLGGGMPIGACVGIGQAGSILTQGMHGTTFGGNPVCAAAGLAVIDTIENDALLAHALTLGEQWRAELREVGGAAVREVRGRGLLIAVEFNEPCASALVRHAADEGFIINAPNAHTIRLAPPLTLSDQQAQSFTEALPALVHSARQTLGHAHKED